MEDMTLPTGDKNAGDPADTAAAIPDAVAAAPGSPHTVQDAPAGAQPTPEEETDEQWRLRFIEENQHLLPPRPERPPAPPPSPWDGPRSTWKVPDHLSLRHPKGGYMAMALISRTMDDLDEVTKGERAATYEEVDTYLGHALIAEGLVPFTYTADEAIRWWKSGGYKVLGGAGENIAPDLAPKSGGYGGVAPPDFGGTPPADGLAFGGMPSGATNDAGNRPQLINASFGGALGQRIPWNGFSEGWQLPLPRVSPEQVIKNAGDMATDEIRRRLVALRKAGAGAAARAAAYAGVTVAINTPFTTPLAARLLTEWRDGTSKTTRGSPEVFGWDSAASNELMFGYTGDYYRNISKLGIAQLIAADKLKEGQKTRVEGIPAYDADHGSAGLSDGINVGDAIGTFTYGVTAEVRGQYVYFRGKNAMSLGSFSGDNILRHGQVDNPTRGAFSTTYQEFVWRVPVPVAPKRGK